MTTAESVIERELISKLQDLKYEYRPDTRPIVATHPADRST